MSKSADLMRKIANNIGDSDEEIPLVRVCVVESGKDTIFNLDEGKNVPGRFPDNIRLDQSTHSLGVGQLHAHIHDRKGNEILAVNLDGTASHGTKGRLHKDDAEALIARGFNIRSDRIVEFWVISRTKALEILLE